MPKCDTTGKSSTAKVEKLRAAARRRKIRILRILRILRKIRTIQAAIMAATAAAMKVATMNPSTMVIDTLIHP